MKVLVTGAGALLGQGIIRALRRSALNAAIVAVDPSPLAAGLYWADKAYTVPLATDPAYDAGIRRVLERERPDVVLVGTDVELPFFAHHRRELEAEYATSVLVSDERVVAIADDKWLTNRFLAEHGLPHPRSCLAGDEERLLDETGLPLIVKPRIGARSVGVHVVRSIAELRAALHDVPNAVVQEHVAMTDGEFTAGVLRFDGQPTISIVMRRDLRDGNTYRAFVERFDALNAQVRCVADLLRPYGPANFQFGTVDGEIKIFEINARYSGTTPLRAAVGFNEVELAVRHLVDGAPIIPPAVQHETTILRSWTEDVLENRRLLSGESGVHI